MSPPSQQSFSVLAAESSKRPWRLADEDHIIDSEDSQICGTWSKNDAELIVRSVNAVEALAEVCREIEAIDTRLPFGLRAQLKAALCLLEPMKT